MSMICDARQIRTLWYNACPARTHARSIYSLYARAVHIKKYSLVVFNALLRYNATFPCDDDDSDVVE